MNIEVNTVTVPGSLDRGLGAAHLGLTLRTAPNVGRERARYRIGDLVGDRAVLDTRLITRRSKRPQSCSNRK